MVSDNQPASVEDLAVLTGSGSTGGIGGRPVSVEDLKLVAADMARTDVLFEGNAISASLSGPVTDYDYILTDLTDSYWLFATSETYMGNPTLYPLNMNGSQYAYSGTVKVNMNGASSMSAQGQGGAMRIASVLGIRLGGGQLLADLIAVLGGER